MSWCAYFIPFMFAYSPALIMQGDVGSILLRLALALFGIFIGTIAVVGYMQAKVPLVFRLAYGLTALLLLVQPLMFQNAIWLNAAGVVLGIAAIVREILRGRRAPKLAPG